MNMQRIPFLTLGLVVILLALHFLVPDKELLYFSQTDVQAGEYWRVVSGHLMHADADHLTWNCIGLLVLGTLIEQVSRHQWWITLLVGISSVSILLLSPFSQLNYYAGLSGVLNTMLLVALWHEWSHKRSWWLASIFLACVAKVVFEVCTGGSLLTNISWPPYPWAHVAGLLGGMTMVCLNVLARNRPQSSWVMFYRPFGQGD